MGAVLPQLHSAAVQGRTALGPNAGTLDSRPGRGSLQPQFRHGLGSLCADLDGFSLHAAAVRIPQGSPDRLEHLIRYVARPPIASERLAILPDGRIAHAFKKRWRDGSAAVVFDPLTFLERLAALVPRPRKKLVNYFGVGVVIADEGQQASWSAIQKILLHLGLPADPPDLAPARPPPDRSLHFVRS